MRFRAQQLSSRRRPRRRPQGLVDAYQRVGGEDGPHARQAQEGRKYPGLQAFGVLRGSLSLRRPQGDQALGMPDASPDDRRLIEGNSPPEEVLTQRSTHRRGVEWV